MLSWRFWRLILREHTIVILIVQEAEGTFRSKEEFVKIKNLLLSARTCLPKHLLVLNCRFLALITAHYRHFLNPVFISDRSVT